MRDRGVAIVGTLVGFAIFMVLLLFACQVILRLYATSALTSAATRAAETVAGSPTPEAAVGPAEAAARQQLGSFGAERTTFVWEEVDSLRVVLEVKASTPQLLPVPYGWQLITRTVSVRTERFRQ